jgi:hypothetical protein
LADLERRADASVQEEHESVECVRHGSMAFAYVVALWGFVESGQRIGQGVVAQCDDDIENGGGPTMVVAPVSTATSRRRSKSTGPVASAVTGSLALR